MNILQKIQEKYNDLSKANKRIAEYIIDNIYQFPFMTITELELEIGVSTASISRFSKTMGYNSFSEFQKEFTYLINKDTMPFEQFEISINTETDNILLSEIQYSKEALDNLYGKELDKSIEESSLVLSKAKTVYIIASRTSRSVALFLSYMLKEIRPNVVLLEDTNGDISFELTHINSNDALVAISYSKYSKATYDVSKYCKQNGMKIISITDSLSAPIALLSDFVLVAPNSQKTYSFISTQVVMNALILHLAKLNPSQTKKSIDLQHKVADVLGSYAEIIEK